MRLIDDHHAARVLHAPPALVPYLEAGVLAPVDVHVADTLHRVLGPADDEVLLAAALAVRAPRLAHVCVDLQTVRATVVADADADDADDREQLDLDALPWPEPGAWSAAVAASPLVTEREPTELEEPRDAGSEVAPLTLAGSRLYLDRYWRYERRVARALDDRASRPVEDIDLPALRDGLDRAGFTGDAPDRQRVAAATAVTRHLTIVAGGPGTGKTTTVAGILRLLDEQAEALGVRPPAVALAAPTGKAAQRLTASLREAAEALAPVGQGAAASDRLREATATTLHQVLGPRGRSSRFRHDRHDPLPHDVVVVDETSMVDLALLAKLLDAVRADARVILLGDPHQLASVEAGSALGDVLGDAHTVPTLSAGTRATLEAAAGPAHLADTDTVPRTGAHDATVVLDRVHRFRAGSGLDRLAAAIRDGDADLAVEVLGSSNDLTWVALPERAADGRWAPTDEDLLADVRAQVVAAGTTVSTAAATGDHAGALAALDRLRVLCAHRRGDQGVAGWVDRIERWLAAAGAIDATDPWYVGRPVLVTTNDRRQQLSNGDLGVVVPATVVPAVGVATIGSPAGGGRTVAFPSPDGTGTRTLAPARLGEVQTVHAMTVHKAQGSQVDHAVVVLPEPASRLCTRELLYTAVTRARERATVVASEAGIRATISSRIARTSGLADALRPPS